MNGIEGARHIAGQITTLLDQIDRRAYAQPLDLFNGSTLGQHFRHILEFYRCLVRDAESGVIDYARRDRDPQVENDPGAATRAFLEVVRAVVALREEREISVRADFSADSHAHRPVVQSSIGRELMFAYDHAVHHLAIIKIGLQSGFPHLSVDPNLGVAPSTVKYRATNGQAENR